MTPQHPGFDSLTGETPRLHALLTELRNGCTAGDLGRVRATLHPEVSVTIDDGGTANTLPASVRGVERAARLLLQVIPGAAGAVTEQSVNGQAGLVFHRDVRVVGVLSASVRSGALNEIWIVLNPEKLRHWNEG